MSKRIYLNDIVTCKKNRIKERSYNSEELLKKISKVSNKPSFYSAMSKKGLSIVGEIKKASPSKGLIKENFNPTQLANEYKNTVDAISVLTEEDYFLGSDKYLKEVSENVEIPTLCKDFIIDKNQIYNAKVLGASCVLLIVTILDNKQLNEFIAIAYELSMDALVEVHSKEDIDRALKAGAKIIGINNRDLKNFKTDINVTLQLRKYIPNHCLVISESGINKVDDIKKLSQANINGILVGESFMRCDDIKKKAKEFKVAYES